MSYPALIWYVGGTRGFANGQLVGGKLHHEIADLLQDISETPPSHDQGGQVIMLQASLCCHRNNSRPSKDGQVMTQENRQASMLQATWCYPLTAQRSIAWHGTAQHGAKQRSATQCNAAQHSRDSRGHSRLTDGQQHSTAQHSTDSRGHSRLTGGQQHMSKQVPEVGPGS